MTLITQTPEERTQWLANLKVGDAVCCVDHGVIGESKFRIFKITRLTPTQAICDLHWRFRLKDGVFLGASFTDAGPVTNLARDNVSAWVHREWLRQVFNSRSTLSLKVMRAMKQAHDLAIAEEVSLKSEARLSHS